jgi:hypothetical protein
VLKAQFYTRLKDVVKDKIAKADCLTTLQRIITTAIRINNHFYKQLLEQRGHYQQGNKQKGSRNKPY